MHDHRHAFRRHLVLGSAAATLLLACGCSKSSQSKGKILAKDATLLCLGDSLTFGYGAGAGGSYPQRLEQLTGHVTQNAGVNGNTAEQTFANVERMAPLFGHYAQDFYRLPGDFGTDTVTGKYENIQIQTMLL